jgi:23S rRNA G2069 N7-methylase RlmK/C1962 C5-methylase RlmI
MNLKILHESEHWFVIEKPHGVSTHSAHSWDMGVVEFLSLYQNRELYVVSRLDKETSGVLLFAKTKVASKWAQEIHEKGQSQKEYIFLTHKKPSWNKVTCDLPLDEKPCHTQFQFVEKVGPFYKMKAVLHRGRKHQVRRHASHLGIPVCGDTLYQGVPYYRLCLHCQSVQWPDVGMLSSDQPSFHQGTTGELGAWETAFARRFGVFEGITQAFRWIHRGELSGMDVCLDQYGSDLICWDYQGLSEGSSRSSQWLEFVEFWIQKTGSTGMVVKSLNRDPHNSGLVGQQLVLGEPPPPYFWVNEMGIFFKVTLTEGPHVGLFLDHRDNRARLRRASQGKKLGNLFSYTGSFSAQSLAGGARSVVSVDSSGNFLDWCRQNVDRNSLSDGKNAKVIKEDVRIWLRRQSKQAQKADYDFFDWIVNDPPTFSGGTSGGHFSVEKEWRHLSQMVYSLLKPGQGRAFFSTNCAQSSLEFFKKILQESFEHVHEVSLPLDFPSSQAFPDYIKHFFVSREILG